MQLLRMITLNYLEIINYLKINVKVFKNFSSNALSSGDIK